MSVLKAERTDFVRKGGGNVSEPAHQILKDARKEAGLTQIQVAALLSVSVEQVKRMERGDEALGHRSHLVHEALL